MVDQWEILPEGTKFDIQSCITSLHVLSGRDDEVIPLDELFDQLIALVSDLQVLGIATHVRSGDESHWTHVDWAINKRYPYRHALGRVQRPENSLMLNFVHDVSGTHQ